MPALFPATIPRRSARVEGYQAAGTLQGASMCTTFLQWHERCLRPFSVIRYAAGSCGEECVPQQKVEDGPSLYALAHGMPIRTLFAYIHCWTVAMWRPSLCATSYFMRCCIQWSLSTGPRAGVMITHHLSRSWNGHSRTMTECRSWPRLCWISYCSPSGKYRHSQFK